MKRALITSLSVVLITFINIAFMGGIYEAAAKDRVARDFGLMDKDGDDKISVEEWNRRGNFNRLDLDADGYLNLAEVRALYRAAWKENKSSAIKPLAGEILTEIDGRVPEGMLSKEVRCAIGRFRRCDPKSSVERGLFPTGLGPVFPRNASCRGIDDYYAMPYGFKRKRDSYHGGIDMPAPWGTAMIAIANGTVVAIFKGDKSPRGIEIVLRHSPEDTGIPLWIYSAYAHLDRLPDMVVGQKVAMGQVLGPTGNSGISPKTGKQNKGRRPAIHFSTLYSTSKQYSESQNIIIPLKGYWLDPNAFYRGKVPLDTAAMKALPNIEKAVPIPVMFEDGSTNPPNTKLVWPYTCRQE